MKYRIAKKILLSPHWVRRWNAMRPAYYNDKGHYCQPSWHDIPDPRFQRAKRRYFKYWRARNPTSLDVG